MLKMIKAMLPPRWRMRLRELRAKVRNVRTYRAFRRSPGLAVRYLLFDHETDNFTYDISNRGELEAFLAEALNSDPAAIGRYIDELDSDAPFRDAIGRNLASRPGNNDSAPYGRRLGWYAAVRESKPLVVVETGVHDGLGSAVLLRALDRNAGEGTEGRLLSFDVVEDVGWLVPDWLRGRYELRIGDAIANLDDALAGRRVDFFIHDSDHRYEHETGEFEAIIVKADPGAVLISDNAHGGTAFRDFCERRGLTYRFFREKPANHFYPGAGIGLAVVTET